MRAGIFSLPRIDAVSPKFVFPARRFSGQRNIECVGDCHRFTDTQEAIQMEFQRWWYDCLSFELANGYVHHDEAVTASVARLDALATRVLATDCT